jgi:hypothetical protein
MNMALSKTINLQNGLTVSNAYIRIDSIAGNKDILTISVGSYVSQQAFQEGRACLEQKTYSFTPSLEEGSANFIKQGYEYLKTLDEYQDASDC